MSRAEKCMTFDLSMEKGPSHTTRHIVLMINARILYGQDHWGACITWTEMYLIIGSYCNYENSQCKAKPKCIS